jgi:hypothetical protein
MIMEVLKIDQQTENPMASTLQTAPHRASCHEVLASRLFQLANDTDRVGMHREATALAQFAASVRDGRKVDVTDA